MVRNGLVVDGTGERPNIGDVAAAGAFIIAVANHDLGGALGALGVTMAPHATVLDASGRIVIPGWVDIHTRLVPTATPVARGEQILLRAFGSPRQLSASSVHASLRS